jgi:hypothetical protein
MTPYVYHNSDWLGSLPTVISNTLPYLSNIIMKSIHPFSLALLDHYVEKCQKR